MRIAIVAANQGLVGGVETYLSWLIPELIARGHEVAFAFERPAIDPARAVAAGVASLRLWDLQTVSRSTFLDELREARPDVVYMHALEDEALDVLLAQRFRAVLFAHAFYATCATGWRVHRFPKREVCTRRFGAACLPINYLRGCGSRNPIQLLRFYAIQQTRAEVLAALAGLVVASEYMRDVYLQHGVPARHVHVIPPLAELGPGGLPEVRESPSRVLFLGRLTSTKGAAKAIEVVARSQRALGRRLSLTMAGDGPELSRCKELARELGVATDFPGWVGPEQRSQLLRAADVLLVPSMWPEPFGMVGVEAGVLGVPAVAYAVGGIVDWLRPGVSGELADASGFETEALAEALARALRDPEHYRELQLGVWRIAQGFNGERHLSKLEALFGSLSAAEAH